MLLAVGATSAWAQTTEIYSDTDWNNFAASVRNGTTYSGSTVHLRANISITSQANQAGADGKYFQGTFEGHGNTITVNMTATGNNCAPFYGVENATIDSLVVTGSITSNYGNIGGISGAMEGNSTYTDCLSAVNITSTKTDGDVSCGGFNGRSGGGANPTFVGCAFTGSLTASQDNCAGFIGFHASMGSYWSGNYGGRSTYTNCLFAPSSINVTSGKRTAVFTAGYELEGTHLQITVNNSYYNEEGAEMHLKQGAQAYTVTAASPVTVAMNGTASDEYSTSGITAYSSCIVYNGTIYGGNGSSLSLNLSGCDTGYRATAGTLTGTGNPYTLTMTSNNSLITAFYGDGYPYTVLEDFETGDFSKCNWTFGGNANWTIVSNEHNTGSYCAKSGGISHNQNTDLIITGDFTAGTVSFYYKVSSENSYDFLHFYIDGVEKNSWSGTVGWSQASYDVSAGTHTLKWSYTKDGSQYGGSDCAWVDDITNLPVIAPAFIASKADWEAFCSAVNSGYDYSGKTVNLMADVGSSSDPVTTMCGTYTSDSDYKAFKGTFNGGGHTLTISLSDQPRFAAPFKFVEGATIQNLHTAGSITGSSTNDGKILAGIVGVSKGTTNIIGCSSSMNITSYFNNGDDVALAGLVASTKGTGTLTVEGCVFKGSMTASTNNKNHSSGIVGYPYSSATINVRNTVFAPTSLTLTTGDTDYSSTFARQANSATVNIENCYYNTVLGVVQGKELHTITGQSPATVAMSGTETNYGASGIKAYKNGSTQLPGLLYNGTVIAGSGDNVRLTLSGGDEYQTNYGTLTGSGGSYTLGMTANNTVISAIQNVPATLPYTEDFENGQNGWEFGNGTQTNYWMVGSNTSYNSSNSLYITNDGSANAYSHTTSYVYAYRKLNIPSAGDYVVSFKWKANGESTWDLLRAFMIPASVNPTLTGGQANNMSGSGNTTPANWIDVANPSGKLNLQTTWQSSDNTVNLSTAGEYYLVFFWKNDGGGGSTPPAAVDNIDVHAALTYTITATANPSASGTVSGGGTIAENNTCRLNAIPNVGYNFVNWTESGTVVSTNPTYSFTVTGNRTLVANFEAWTLNVASEPASTECLTPGTEVVLTASSNIPTYNNYTFTQTTETFSSISSSPDGTSTNTGDAATFAFQLPFAFNLAGKDLSSGTTVTMRCDGHVSIGTVYSAHTPSSPGSTYTVISPLGYDQNLNSGESYMYYKVTGSTGSRVLTMEWKNMRSYSSTNSAYNWTNYQVKLYEGSNIVKLCYGSFTYNYSCSIHTYLTADGKMTKLTGSYANPAVETNTTGATTSISVNSASAAPANGTVYTFAPFSYTWTANGTQGTANGDTYTVTPTESSTYTVSVTVGSQTFTETVNVTVIIPCAVPTNFIYTALGSTYVTLTWKAGDEEEEWQVKYYTNDEDNPIATYSVTGQPTKTITGLTKNTVYYAKVRAVCDAETNSAWSDEIEFDPDVKSFENSNGTSSWDDPANWTPYGVPTLVDDVIVNFDVTIPEGCQALANTVTINVDVEPTITIEDGGQLWHNNEEEGESPIKVTIKKTIDAYEGNDYLAEGNNKGFEIISFPVDGLDPTSVDGLIPTTPQSDPYAFYAFVPYNTDSDGTNYLEWVHYGSDNFGDVNPYRGYLYSRRDGTEISVTGEVMSSGSPATGDVYKLYGGERFDGWALMGNPFVCNAYVTSNVGEMNFYKIGRTTEQQDYDEFVPFDNSTPIEPMGGVMVRFYEDMDGVVYSRELLTGEANSGILNMVARKANSRSANSRLDRARLRFGTGRNLPKLQLNPNHTKVYIPEGAKDYAVYYTEGAGSVPVNFKAEENGRYTLDFSTENVSFNYLHLIDNMTGADVDLLETPYYTFSAKSTDYESRFKVVFATGEASNDDNFAFYSNGSWVVNNEGEATLQVIDVMGHVLSSERISGATTKAINAASGIYMLRLINGDNVKVQKIVVR